MGTEELLLNGVFYVFAIGAVAAAIGVALSPNIIRSAFSLLGVLFSVAALYAFMHADFIVAAQIIIYVGGILVLIIFAVMLTHKITDVNVSNESAHGPAALLAVLCVFGALVVISTWMWKWDRSAPPESAQAVDVMVAGESKEKVKAALDVSLLHGDGMTGVLPAGEVRGPFLGLKVRVTDASARIQSVHLVVEASLRTENQPDESKRWGPWTVVRTQDLSLTQGMGTGEQRHSNLKPGRYRWTATFVDAKGPLLLGKYGCPTCQSEGEPSAVCMTESCSGWKKSYEKNLATPCPHCKALGVLRAACATATCDQKGRMIESKPRLRCPSCGSEGKAGAVCLTPECVEKGKPLVTQAWELRGTEFMVEAGLTRPLGVALMGRYLLPFELVSVLLLAALVGAAYLARKEVKDV